MALRPSGLCTNLWPRKLDELAQMAHRAGLHVVPPRGRAPQRPDYIAALFLYNMSVPEPRRDELTGYITELASQNKPLIEEAAEALGLQARGDKGAICGQIIQHLKDNADLVPGADGRIVPRPPNPRPPNPRPADPRPADPPLPPPAPQPVDPPEEPEQPVPPPPEPNNREEVPPRQPTPPQDDVPPRRRPALPNSTERVLNRLADFVNLVQAEMPDRLGQRGGHDADLQRRLEAVTRERNQLEEERDQLKQERDRLTRRMEAVTQAMAAMRVGMGAVEDGMRL